MEVFEPTMIYYDNFRNIQLAKNSVFHTWTKQIEVHYHFVYEQVLSSEVERIGACSNKLACGCHFLSMLVLHHLNMSNLRGRSKSECERDEVWNVDLDVEFDFGTAEEAEDRCKGSGPKNELELDSIIQGASRAKKGKACGRAYLNRKAKTKTSLDVVKGLQEDE